MKKLVAAIFAAMVFCSATVPALAHGGYGHHGYQTTTTQTTVAQTVAPKTVAVKKAPVAADFVCPNGYALCTQNGACLNNGVCTVNGICGGQGACATGGVCVNPDNCPNGGVPKLDGTGRTGTRQAGTGRGCGMRAGGCR